MLFVFAIVIVFVLVLFTLGVALLFAILGLLIGDGLGKLHDGMRL